MKTQERRLIANFSTYLADRDFYISFVLMRAARQYAHVNKAKFVIVSSRWKCGISSDVPIRHPCEVALIKLIRKTLKSQETKFRQGKDRTSRNRGSLSNYAMLFEVHFTSI